MSSELLATSYETRDRQSLGDRSYSRNNIAESLQHALLYGPYFLRFSSSSSQLVVASSHH